MSEAQPAKKVGGHTYGRRNVQLSNTAEEGELCLYAGHAIGRFSASSMRYDSHASLCAVRSFSTRRSIVI